MDRLLYDIESSWRSLRRAPVFSLLAVVMLAAAIGANTVAFTLVRAVLLRPLPYPDASRLLAMEENNSRLGLLHFKVAPADFESLRASAQSLERVAAYDAGSLALTGGNNPERISGAAVSADFFRVLAAQPFLGRDFRPGEDLPGSRVAILSYALWARRFGSSSAALGQKLRLDGDDYSVIGIMPRDFRFYRGAGAGLESMEVWISGEWTPKYLATHGHELSVIARRRPGVSPESLRHEMAAFSRRLAENDPADNRDWSVDAESLQLRLLGKLRPFLILVEASVAFLLLIAIVNMANLSLARAFVQRQQTAVRSALGATRPRLAQQFLTESLLLSFAGGAFGVLFASLALPAVLRISGAAIPFQDRISLDRVVLFYTLLLSTATGLLFGLGSLLLVGESTLGTALRERANAARRGTRVWQPILIASEIALTLALLAAAGLSLRNFTQLLHADPGFRPGGVLTLDLSLPVAKYSARPAQAAFVQQLLGRIRALPGVRSAAIATAFPFKRDISTAFRPDGYFADPQNEPAANWYVVTPGYFRTLGIPLLAGRDFDDSDRPDSVPVAIVCESLARRYFPRGDALGKRIQEGHAWRTIVAIVRDVKQFSLADSPVAQIYEPYAQRGLPFFTLAVDSENGNPQLLAQAIRNRILSLDSEQPVYSIVTLDALLSDSLSNLRMSAVLLSAFAAMSLLLALTGLYGVLEFAVNRRKAELGVRMALGASPRAIHRFMLAEHLCPVFGGVCLGLALAYAAAHWLSTAVYDSHAPVAAIFCLASAVVLVIAAVAIYLPARRAAAVDPIETLRTN